MMPSINAVMLAVSSSPAASIVAKATAITGMALIGARLTRNGRAAVRHALLAAAFGALLILPIASILAPPVRIAVLAAAQERNPNTFAGASSPMEPGAPARESAGVTSAGPQPAGFSLAGLLFMGWLAGAALFLAPVGIGLWQVRTLRRSALPWPHGQSLVERLALEAGIHRRVEALLHEALRGPMTCGTAHPAIVLPDDAQTWERDDLNRAIVHELEHVRRGDWLTRCLARTICAVYWFHPLVWIAWRHFALEAERSCDDAVLARSESTAYADQLVALARRAVQSPLLAMANRSDLAKRVRAVLDGRQRRGRAGIIAVATACAAAVALVITMSPLRMVAAQPSAAAQTAATREFDAVSVKLVDRNTGGEHSHEDSDPGRLTMIDSMHRFIIRAYGITEGQLSGEPAWFNDHLYSINAVTSAPAGEAQMMLMLRRVLADRFQLKLRQEDRDLAVYALEVAAGGPKFKEVKPGGVPERKTKEPPDVFLKRFTSIDDLMNSLNGVFGGRLKLDRPVVDRTHLTGHYYMELRTEIEIRADDSGHRAFQFPNLFHDMQSELGLKLVQTRVGMPYFVVEHAAEPTPN